MRALLVAAALFAVAAPVSAQAPSSSAVLINASSVPAGRIIVDGAAWRCDGNACASTGGSNQPVVRACRRVVAQIGKVSAFTYRGTALSADQLAACNA